MLKQPKPKSVLLKKQGPGREERYSPENSDVLIVPAAGPQKQPFAPEPDTERDVILRRALDHLSKHDVAYVPLDIEEDIQASYEDDTLEEFRGVVRGWMKELAKV